MQYDFNNPCKLPRRFRDKPGFVSNRRLICNADELKGSFDRIICDPPFLSDDCHTKGSSTHDPVPS